VIAVAALDPEAVGEKRIAPGSIHKELRAPAALAVAGLGLDADVIPRRKLDLGDAAFLDRPRTSARAALRNKISSYTERLTSKAEG
jgi:hypothetical protein